jgi:hypothetical protein
MHSKPNFNIRLSVCMYVCQILSSMLKPFFSSCTPFPLSFQSRFSSARDKSDSFLFSRDWILRIGFDRTYFDSWSRPSLNLTLWVVMAFPVLGPQHFCLWFFYPVSSDKCLPSLKLRTKWSFIESDPALASLRLFSLLSLPFLLSSHFLPLLTCFQCKEEKVVLFEPSLDKKAA